MSKRKKYIVQVTRDQLEFYWKMPVPKNWTTVLYVQSKKNGIVTDWNKALVYQAHEINEADFQLVPLITAEHECKHCGSWTTEPDEHCYKAPIIIKKGDIVYTTHYPFPGIVKCEVIVIPDDKTPFSEMVLLQPKHVLMIDTEMVEKVNELLNDVVFTKKLSEISPYLDDLFQQIAGKEAML